MFLVPIKSNRVALSSVSHFRVFDRNATLQSYAFANSHSAVARRFEVLLTNLHERVNIRLQRTFDDVVDMPLDPTMKRGNLPFNDFDRRGFLPCVAPIDVESGLDAWRQEQRNSRSARDLFGLAVG